MKELIFLMAFNSLQVTTKINDVVNRSLAINATEKIEICKNIELHMHLDMNTKREELQGYALRLQLKIMFNHFIGKP